MSTEAQTAFFSYCREDSDFALKLAEDLKAAGAHVWIDQLDIEPGAPWDRAVEEALNNAPRMLVVLSPVSVNSDNVRDEVSFALSRQKRVIPVLYRDCEIPFRLARLQYIDFRPDYGRGLKILLRALGAEQSAPHLTASSADPGPLTAANPSAEDMATAQHHEEELQRERAAIEREHLEEEARRATDKARVEQEEREKAETERQAGQERSRREQRLAEQARLEEEARQAAEGARVAQEERARKEIEIKTRQEQLRREEQESVERKQFDLAQFEQQERARAIDSVKVKPGSTLPPASRVAPTRAQEIEKPGTAVWTGRSKLYVWGAVVLIVLIGLTVFLVRRGNNPATGENKAAESKSSQPPATPLSQPSQVGNSGASTGSPGATAQSPASQTMPEAGNAPPQSGSGSPAQDSQESQRPPPKAAELAVKSAAVSSTATKGTGGLTRVQLPADVSKNFLTHQVPPPYPPLARQARIQGIVKLKVLIDKDGTVQNIKTVSGHPMLVPAAINAVKQWRYRPFIVDNKPVEVDTVVTVKFDLTN